MVFGPTSLSISCWRDIDPCAPEVETGSLAVGTFGGRGVHCFIRKLCATQDKIRSRRDLVYFIARPWILGYALLVVTFEVDLETENEAFCRCKIRVIKKQSTSRFFLASTVSVQVNWTVLREGGSANTRVSVCALVEVGSGLVSGMLNSVSWSDEITGELRNGTRITVSSRTTIHERTTETWENRPNRSTFQFRLKLCDYVLTKPKHLRMFLISSYNSSLMLSE